MLTFAMRLRGLRNIVALSQAELGQRAGVSQFNVSNYERGLQPQSEHIPALDRAIHEEAERLRIQLPFTLVDEALPVAA